MDGIYEVTIGGVNGTGNYAENVIHYALVGTSSGQLAYETARDLVTAWNTANAASFAACLGNEVSINILSARRVDGPGGPTFLLPINHVGTGANPSYSNVAAIDIAMYPGGAKNKVGHWYFWGFDLAAVISDILQSPWLATLATFLTALIAVLPVGTGSARLSTYTKATNVATFVSDLITRGKLSGFSKRTAPVT